MKKLIFLQINPDTSGQEIIKAYDEVLTDWTKCNGVNRKSILLTARRVLSV